MLKMYARKFDPSQPYSRGIPFGVVVARPDGYGDVQIGWSQCSENDRFDRNLGTRIALSRLEHSPMSGNEIMDGYIDPSWDWEFAETVEEVISEIERNPTRYMEKMENV